ncbi:amidase [Denitratisoma sp. DHT3]|uniref:amidase n=1 Tax=Denitratisoma sp. DHT3 TaxID=1981880 RepID=UPI00119873DB|nr:amidase family protein [Denitratisoma sp. DHT3]QDX80475.1 amidase [Denitratisoma sp. DHT3]
MSTEQEQRRKLLKTGGALALTTALGGVGRLAQAASLPMAEYDTLDAVALAQLVKRRQVSAGELLEAAIARAEIVSPVLNPINLRHYELARATAKTLPLDGPLAGVPYLLKDLGIALKGTVTSNGCAFFKDAVADYDSTLTERYRKAGLVIFGKTTSPEFGQTATTESKLWGLTRNPWNPAYSSGGSSGGAAVAVATGIVPAAHASDGGGSIRIPASHCGLFGLKPSRGRLPMGPKAIENWMGLSMQHAITRSVRDSALLLQISQGPEAGTRAAPPAMAGNLLEAIRRPSKALRIALLETNPFGAPIHPECLAAVRKTAKLCESLGHRVEIAAPVLPIGDMFAGMGVMTATGMLTTVRNREKLLGREVREDEMEPLNWRALRQAKTYSAEQLYRARAAFDEAGRLLDEFLGRYDLILSPTTADLPPKLGVISLDRPYEEFAREAMKASPFTAMFNMSGHPAMSVPLHWTPENLPIGSQFAARFGDELTLLRLAAQLEQAAPWKDRRPPKIGA